MRTVDRRDGLLRLLRRRADWTVADLARELAVSRRTVLRDLGALREAGFDVDTFSGPGGGVRLNPTAPIEQLARVVDQRDRLVNRQIRDHRAQA